MNIYACGKEIVEKLAICVGIALFENTAYKFIDLMNFQSKLIRAL